MRFLKYLMAGDSKQLEEISGKANTHSFFDPTRVQFLIAAIFLYTLFIIVSALFYFLFNTKDVQWDMYEIIVTALSLPYVITVFLTNIFCIFRGENGYDSF